VDAWGAVAALGGLVGLADVVGELVVGELVLGVTPLDEVEAVADHSSWG
jgi:hypothetical protein